MKIEEFIKHLTQSEVDTFWETINKNDEHLNENGKYFIKREEKQIPFKWFIQELGKSKNSIIDFNSNYDTRDKFCERFAFEIYEQLLFNKTEKDNFINFFNNQVKNKVLFQYFIEISHTAIVNQNINPYKVRMAITRTNEAMIIIGMRAVLSYKNDKIGFIINADKYEYLKEHYNIEKDYNYKGGDDVIFVYISQNFIPDVTINSLMEINYEVIGKEYKKVENSIRSRWNVEANTTNSALKYVIFKNEHVEKFIEHNKEFEMEYFDIKGIVEYKELSKLPYSTDAEATKIFNDTREKLYYLVELLSKKLNENFTINYAEKPNKQAGRGVTHQNYKDYIIIGFLPSKYKYLGKDIFLKASFGFWEDKINFHYQFDINFKDGNNRFDDNDRNFLLELNPIYLDFETEFPDNWNYLIEISHLKVKQLFLDFENFINGRNLKEEFTNWLIEKSSPNYYDNDRNQIIKKLDKYNSYFNFNIFDCTENNYLDVISKIRNVIYSDEEIEFQLYSKSEQNHIPKAILGKGNYLKFLTEKFTSTINNEQKNLMDSQNISYSLNQILFGAPGTGKTFSTKKIAVEIITRQKFDNSKESRTKILNLYEDYSQKKQIRFTTFHQSLSYEDFIEGIKPILNSDDEIDNNVEYKVISGIFKTSSAISAYNCYKIQMKNENMDKAYSFDELHEAFLDYNRNSEEKKIYTSISGKSIEIFDINKNDSIRARAQGSRANHIAPLTKENMQKLYDEFLHIDEIKNLQQIKNTVGISPRLTEFYAIFKGLKDFEKNIFHPTDEVESEKIEIDLDEEDIIKKFEAGVFTNAVKLYDKIAEPVVIIIDEINRGNVSAIFGELITLLEEDKRQGKKEAIEVILPYSKSTFSIPSNLYIIGTMNTADRSVEALDTALRRRFSFLEMKSEPEILTEYHSNSGIVIENNFEINLIHLLQKINQRIELLIDKDHQIGHSYFIKVNNFSELKTTFKDKIIPLLEEYFYGDFGKIGLVLGKQFIETKYKNQSETKGILATFTDYEETDFITDKKIFQIKNVEPLEARDFISVYDESVL